jgi:hypothetical protein
MIGQHLSSHQAAVQPNAPENAARGLHLSRRPAVVKYGCPDSARTPQ